MEDVFSLISWKLLISANAKEHPPPPTTKPINTTGYQKDVFKPGMFNQSTLEKEAKPEVIEID